MERLLSGSFPWAHLRQAQTRVRVAQLRGRRPLKAPPQDPHGQ